ncbi:unnamed protein product [Auanema sp. JU1783]|nr:unnamed protein product [Auanema sp. JU1783]
MARDDVNKRVNKRNENKQHENKVDESGKVEKKSFKHSKMDNYKKAKMVYDQIQEDRRVQREEKMKARELKQAAREKTQTQKKKMNRAIKKHNKKGQPNLGSQMEAILSKIERNMND